MHYFLNNLIVVNSMLASQFSDEISFYLNDLIFISNLILLNLIISNFLKKFNKFLYYVFVLLVVITGFVDMFLILVTFCFSIYYLILTLVEKVLE